MEYEYGMYATEPRVDVTAEGLLALMGIFVLFFFIVVVCYAVTAWLLGRVFKKAGTPQWIAWVPVYNNWKILELGGQQGFWAVLGLIPLVSIVAAVFTYIAMYHIGKKTRQRRLVRPFGDFLAVRMARLACVRRFEMARNARAKTQKYRVVNAPFHRRYPLAFHVAACYD